MKSLRVPVLLLACSMLISGCFLLPERKDWSDDEQAAAAAARGLMVPGEKLTYTIRTGSLKLGEALLSINVAEKNVDNLELDLFINSTHPWLPVLSFTSEVNKDDFSTVSFSMEDTRKSEIRRSVQFRPDYSSNRAESVLMKRKSVEKHTLELTGRTYDYVSLIYILRKKLPGVGENLAVPVFDETLISNVTIANLASRDLVLRNVGKFKGVKLQPALPFAGLEGDITLWMDETFLIPVRFTIRLSFGTVVLELQKAENTQTGAVIIQ